MEVESCGSYTFKHFDTTNQCETYLMNNPHILVSYTCCGGRGYASPLRKPPTRILTQKESPELYDETVGTCEICFVEDKTLYSMCTCCRQPFCIDCLKQCASKPCPYCRGKLRVF